MCWMTTPEDQRHGLAPVGWMMTPSPAAPRSRKPQLPCALPRPAPALQSSPRCQRRGPQAPPKVPGPIQQKNPRPVQPKNPRPGQLQSPRPAGSHPPWLPVPSTGPQPAAPPLTSLPVYVPDQGMTVPSWGSRPVTVRRPGPGSGAGPLPNPLLPSLPNPLLPSLQPAPVPPPGPASVPDREAKADAPKVPALLSPTRVSVAGCTIQAAPTMFSPPTAAKGMIPPPGLTGERARDLSRSSQPD